MSNPVTFIFDNTIGKLGGFFGGLLKGIGWGILQGKAVEMAVDKGDDLLDQLLEAMEKIRDENLKKLPVEEFALIAKYMKAVKGSLVSGEEKFDFVVNGYVAKWPQISKDIAKPLVQSAYDNLKDLFDL